MYFSELEIINYRNYSRLKLPLTIGVNVFFGENGQGKTNLIEALHFLAKGESFRPGNVPVFVSSKEPDGPAILRAKVQSPNWSNKVQLTFQNNRKNLYLDEKRTSSTQLLQRFPMVLFSPESLQAIKSGPDARRSLIDDFLVSFKLSNSKILSDFKKSLKQRNQLLKDLKTGRISETTGRDILNSLNPLFLRHATELSIARTEALQGLIPFLNLCMREILNIENVDISVEYLISGQSALDWNKEQLYNAMQNRLKDLSQREIESGGTLVGPQKHDIQFLFNGNDARYYCSQGQQRALILSFKMAQIMYHYRVYQIHPVLLLDDVLSELDFDKRANLVEFLKRINTQIFITTTELTFPYDFGDRDLKLFKIEKGEVKRELIND